jgi:hypothetical protein
MNLELRRFQREYRKRGGVTLRMWESPPVRPSVDLRRETINGKPGFKAVLVMNNWEELPAAIRSLREKIDALI